MIILYFSVDLTASQISELTKVNRNTINRLLLLLRKRLAQRCEEATSFKGVIKLLWSAKTKGKRGRGAPKS